MKQVSDKRAVQMREYTKLRKGFLTKYIRCVVYPTKSSTQIHHARGREGKLLNETKYWLPVSSAGHRWIHDNPAEAKARNLMLTRSGILDLEEPLINLFQQIH